MIREFYFEITASLLLTFTFPFIDVCIKYTHVNFKTCFNTIYKHFMINSLLQVSIFGNPSQFCTLILAVIVMTLQIFIPCYCGNEVILSSGALNNAIYNADWIQCPPKIRKYLIIYMEMLQVPVIVRAGNFFEIGLPVFVKVTIN